MTSTHLPLTLLFISLLALFVGPLTQKASQKHQLIMAFIDGFTLIVVVELVVFHLLPHALEDVGIAAIGVALLGFGLPGLLEKHLHRNIAKKAHIIALAVAVLGVILHSFADGLALIPTNSNVSLMLPIAVICHQIPVGLTIWWLVRPQYGSKIAFGVLLTMALTTAVGFFTGNTVVPGLDHFYISFFEALVAGSLLHVMFHRHEHLAAGIDMKKWRKTSGAGAIAAVTFIVLINRFFADGAFIDPNSEHLEIFTKLALESAPALVVAYILAGLIHAFISSAPVHWLRSGGNFRQAFKGMAFGLPLPICSCGVVPVYRSLMQKGIPLSAGIAFFVATPELGIEAALLSLPLLGAQMTVIRLVCAALVALAVGYLVGTLNKDLITSTKDVETTAERSFLQKLQYGLKTGLTEVVDHTAPWIMFGLWIAAMAHPILAKSEFLNQLPDSLEVILFALLGMPIYVCASGVTPFVAVLIFNGVSPGAAIAFLLTGPATNVTTFGILTDLHGRKVAIQFAAIMAVTTIGLGYVVNFFFANSAKIGANNPLTHVHHGYQSIFLLVLAGIFFFALLRNGPRFLINQIVAFESFASGTAHKHNDHKHDHHHTHTEEPKPKTCCSHNK